MTSTEMTPGGLQQAEGSGTEEGLPTWARSLFAILALYLFVAAVKMIGGGLGVIRAEPEGAAFLNKLFGLVQDPITGLVVGLLVTALVQASGFTIAMTVTLTAMGQISFATAIPIIMGANIGTSITGLLVSLGHVRQRDEFRRSLSAASVHDFFNMLSVVTFLPLEIKFGVISRPVAWLAGMMGYDPNVPGEAVKLASKAGPIKIVISALGKLFEWLLLTVMNIPPKISGAIICALAMVFLFGGLMLMVKMLRTLMQGRLSGIFNKTLFGNPAAAFIVGIVMTIAVQSSSVSISLVVPLVGAEILQLAQVFPYVLGSNIGTTFTVLLPALALGPVAVACACGHLLFNIYGTVLFWPLRALPMGMAKWFGNVGANRRYLAVVYILTIFFVIPGGILGIMKVTGNLESNQTPARQDTTIIEDGATDGSQETLVPITE
jgi:solute carrier family 34 (sodium-dependent phosphate cotransporter)